LPRHRRMGRDGDLYQDVARWSAIASGAAAALDADMLAILHADGNLDVYLFPGGHHDPPRSTTRRFIEADRRPHAEIFSAHRLRTSASTAAAEQVGENVLCAEAFLRIAAGVVPGKMEVARATTAKRPAGTKAAALSRIEAPRIACGIDFTGVEFGALFLVADDVVGAGDFLKFLLRVLVRGLRVRVMLLGEVAESLFDLGLARGLGHTQDFVRIAHSSSRPCRESAC